MFSWGRRGAASVLVGGQFGSEGKGMAAAWLAEQCENVSVATTNAGAQAGHTTKYRNGREFVCFHLPTTGVVQADRGCMSYINAGSIIDIDALLDEIRLCAPRHVFIHPRAAVITVENKATERAVGSSTTKLASTQKGVGAAISDKIMRRSRLAGDYEVLKNHGFVHTLDLNHVMTRQNGAVVVEVPQATGLSLNHGFAYPYTTSRDCWVGAGLSDSGIHPSFLGAVCMVMRTHPIRVGHFYNEDGQLIGESGPFYGDGEEIDWTELSDLGVEPERTTVTKRIRRIAKWSDAQYEDSLRINRPDIIFLTFCDYLRSHVELFYLLRRMAVVEAKVGLMVQHVFGFGPCVEDVTPWLDTAMGWYSNRSF